MRKFIIWTLAITLFVGTFATPLQAMEPLRLNQNNELVENRRGGRRSPPPRPRRDRDHGRRSHSNSGWGWGFAGAVIGGAIVSGIVNSHRQPEPVLVCDAYGNYYYVYR